MKQRAFEQKFSGRWQRFEDELAAMERAGQSKGLRARLGVAEPLPDDMDDFPQLYRELCRDLSLAAQRRYSPLLLDRLNELALGGHAQLYARRNEFGAQLVRFALHGFPARVRRDRVAVGLAAALFVLPALALFALVLVGPELVYSVLSPEQVHGFEAMYDPASERVGSNRSAASDMQMFGFYIFNNIGVGFRTFATGIAWGLGSAFFLLLNGMLLGAMSAHIIHLGYQQTFFPFVIGHGSFELTAIVISGAAGLKLGYALIAPGPTTRVQALQRAAGESVQLVFGVIVMLIAAALLEAFWSSKATIAPGLKLAVGSVLWLVVFLYFLLLGREHESS
ncbi:MAG: stage II sporulation protein M [Deltaproteobacteria bacterium]|nr:stage II sporulation protein M [Deltaproteobacteria bacterium]